jgi:hypothetical protein
VASNSPWSQSRAGPTVALLLTQLWMLRPAQAVRLLDECLVYKEKREVQLLLGQGYRLLIGQSTGHYVLNLSEDQDRDVLVRLLTVDKEERTWLALRYSNLDTSQHGNRHRFRNELLNGSPVELTPALFDKVGAVNLCLAMRCSPFLVVMSRLRPPAPKRMSRQRLHNVLSSALRRCSGSSI